MTSPADLESRHTLRTAVARYEELRTRDSLADPDDPAGPRPLSREEALELLALGEVIARKARDSQLIGIRAALRGGAGWDDVAAALDIAPEEAWTAYHRLIERQERTRALDPDDAASARDLAGARPRR